MEPRGLSARRGIKRSDKGIEPKDRPESTLPDCVADVHFETAWSNATEPGQQNSHRTGKQPDEIH
jgi:hypothetical protein